MSVSVPHVLIADDDDLVRMLGEALVRSIGGRGTVAADGAAVHAAFAKALAEGDPIDLVLLDLQFGAASGLDICRQLRAELVDIPVVGMSGDAMAHSVEAYASAGFDEVLQKPLSKAQVADCTARFAGKKHAPLERLRAL